MSWSRAFPMRTFSTSRARTAARWLTSIPTTRRPPRNRPNGCASSPIPMRPLRWQSPRSSSMKASMTRPSARTSPICPCSLTPLRESASRLPTWRGSRPCHLRPIAPRTWPSMPMAGPSRSTPSASVAWRAARLSTRVMCASKTVPPRMPRAVSGCCARASWARRRSGRVIPRASPSRPSSALRRSARPSSPCTSSSVVRARSGITATSRAVRSRSSRRSRATSASSAAASRPMWASTRRASSPRRGSTRRA